MSVFNVVRFKVKPGMTRPFSTPTATSRQEWPGLRHANMIKTGDERYCLIAEWESADALAAGRPQMIATLNSFRQTLEDLGSGLGVTDAVSGSVVLPIK